jgi:predicted NAD/FAD-binding protein
MTENRPLKSGKSIAVIGSGISGNACAWALSKHHDVTLYEKRLRPGGHSATINIEYDGIPISVDTGFIVYNPLNYPNLIRLFDYLGVETQASDMSFAFSANQGALEWSGKSLDTVFAQKKNLFSPHFWSMIRGILRFNASARRDLEAGNLEGVSLAEYLRNNKYSQPFINDYLLPMGAAIWSTPSDKMLQFPAKSFLQFFDNHRLIDKNRPEWRTVTGGSRNYVEKLLEDFSGTLKLGCAVTHVEAKENSIQVTDTHNETLTFDEVVFASHTDQTLAMLKDATFEEKSLLSAIAYKSNDVWLHCDEALMPKRKKTWSAWNYMADLSEKTRDTVFVSYSMNILQNIDPAKPLFVSLNPPQKPDPDRVFGRFTYDHPQYDADALKAQQNLNQIQGKRGLWFCGAWTGYGFHEDGLRSGLEVARSLGAILPWEETSGTALSEAAE